MAVVRRQSRIMRRAFRRGPHELRTLYTVCGIAFTCMAGTLMSLFGHAARRAVDATDRATSFWLLPGMLYMLLFMIGPLTTRFRRRNALP
jgi:H+/Cl- antiporter ClcA